MEPNLCGETGASDAPVGRGWSWVRIWCMRVSWDRLEEYGYERRAVQTLHGSSSVEAQAQDEDRVQSAHVNARHLLTHYYLEVKPSVNGRARRDLSSAMLIALLRQSGKKIRYRTKYPP